MLWSYETNQNSCSWMIETIRLSKTSRKPRNQFKTLQSLIHVSCLELLDVAASSATTSEAKPMTSTFAHPPLSAEVKAEVITRFSHEVDLRVSMEIEPNLWSNGTNKTTQGARSDFDDGSIRHVTSHSPLLSALAPDDMSLASEKVNERLASSIVSRQGDMSVIYIFELDVLTHCLYGCIRGRWLDPWSVRSSHVSPIRSECGEVIFGRNYPEKPAEWKEVFVSRSKKKGNKSQEENGDKINCYNFNLIITYAIYHNQLRCLRTARHK